MSLSPNSTLRSSLLLALLFSITTLSLYLLPFHTPLNSPSTIQFPHRRILAVKSDPLRIRTDQIRKQAADNLLLSSSYASYARKLKLDSSKQLRLFAEISRNFSLLISSHRHLFHPSARIEEQSLALFEREVKSRIRTARTLISDAKSSFDNQLKIQKLKDAIFAANERLTKAKKRGAFSSLIAAKSIPRSLHCLAMRLMEERISNSDFYRDPEVPTEELENPRLFHYAIFSDNVLAASVVLNSAVKNAKDPSKHVFHVVTDRMNLGAMQVML